MSIFGIIGVSILISMGVCCLFALVNCFVDEDDCTIFTIGIIVSLVALIASIFIGIGLNTEDAQVWSAKFEAQKTTIEQSLDSEVLSGLERIELVNKAAELNGELAERRVHSELWHVVYYDKNVYKNVEPIVIK